MRYLLAVYEFCYLCVWSVGTQLCPVQLVWTSLMLVIVVLVVHLVLLVYVSIKVVSLDLSVDAL